VGLGTSAVFGKYNNTINDESSTVMWPSDDDFKKMDTYGGFNLKSIEYAVEGDIITALRLHMSDSTASPPLDAGHWDKLWTAKFDFPAKPRVDRVEIGFVTGAQRQSTALARLTFTDAGGTPILNIAGNKPNDEVTVLKLGTSRRIAGIKLNSYFDPTSSSTEDDWGFQNVQFRVLDDFYGY